MSIDRIESRLSFKNMGKQNPIMQEERRTAAYYGHETINEEERREGYR